LLTSLLARISDRTSIAILISGRRTTSCDEDESEEEGSDKEDQPRSHRHSAAAGEDDRSHASEEKVKNQHRRAKLRLTSKRIQSNTNRGNTSVIY